MEAIIVIILLIFGWTIISTLISATGRTAKAAAKTAFGKGSFSDNMQLEFKGMGDFEVRINSVEKDGIVAKEIEARGLFPLSRELNVGAMVSVFDTVDDELVPVISFLEEFQEDESVCYQHQIKIGKVSGDVGFPNWTRVGVVLPEILQGPYSGKRNLLIQFRLINLDNPPAISNGFATRRNDPGTIWARQLNFDYDLSVKGFIEEEENDVEAKQLSIKIGMAIAMADGVLDESEGHVIHDWIKKNIAPFGDDKKEQLKGQYNNALREAYKEFSAGGASLSDLTDRMNALGDKAAKYEALELCFDVMAADGVAAAEELKTIKLIAEKLELDMAKIEQMRDKKLIGLDSSIEAQSSIEDILGIDPSWDKKDVKKHLRVEFQKWNNRLNTLNEGAERENAQRMLDLISEARKRYG